MTGPLTLGTAGHVDHGKTSLVAALTGCDTDRLPEERARGLSIALGYAPLILPNGRQISVIDVPGHERFVRTMVAGATGIDAYLMVIAADDGVMPQTREHWTVLRALNIRRGVVAITKADIADPAAASAQARDLLGPDVSLIPCSARTGLGLANLTERLTTILTHTESRARHVGPVVLHIDRVFAVKGAGTVVTGTLWSGVLRRGDRLAVFPIDQRIRVRDLRVHETPVDQVPAGQRVAVNVTGVHREHIKPGDALVSTEAKIRPSWILDLQSSFKDDPSGRYVHLHHGTRSSLGRLASLGDGRWQFRGRDPLLARAGDRVVIRASSPPNTLGGALVLDPHAKRHRPNSRAATHRTARPDPGYSPPDLEPKAFGGGPASLHP
ncbi:selenocysteine-specific translation elongation factor [Conexibacter sp. W3-3-2]|uniref:selenocysteine-specific translation elongation factor n=1 Tax=Conexibacter sp. W3-3-2 TaxID=2675227 RepID=UPI0012B795D6|nr:selenocysteine-specific translation elongation factor [Conexibacter sp. W3-3-2]MTD47717.1 selenocysteine-specific translation elongation factor [Conexibacter sp. W3-3-2]